MTQTPAGGQSLLAEVQRILAIGDPVARNRQITQAYHDLELAMAEFIGDRDLSWCAYGVWASRQVGEAMDGMAVNQVRDVINQPGFADELGFGASATRLARTAVSLSRRLPDRVFRLALDAVQPRIAEGLGQGNLRVFTELAPTFAGFVDLARSHNGDPDAIALDLPQLYVDLGHVTYEGGAGYELTLACDCYVEAMRAEDSSTRAQYVFYANLRAGHYEQQRVQEPLVNVTASVVETPAALIHQSATTKFLRRIVRRLAPRRAHRVRFAVGQALGRTTTDLAVQLRTPIDAVDVHKPLMPDRTGEFYPADLANLTLPEFARFLDHPNDWMQLGPTPDHEIVTENWVNYHERMPFIAHVMRMRQQSMELRLPPFAPGVMGP